MLKHLKPAILLTLVLTVLTGLAYPVAITGLAGALFPHQAHGSLIERNGAVVGSELIGQNFTRPDYFHPRPSATTTTDPDDPAKTVPAPYNAASSGASNAAPSSRSFIDGVLALAGQLRAENPDAEVALPIDLATASASGLDPHISPQAAEFQVPRVAKARGMADADLRAMIAHATEGRTFGVLGEATVNVLKLNLALDEASGGARR